MGFDVIHFDQKFYLNDNIFKSFNFGINGAGTKVFYNILKHFIFKKVQPKVIFYGLCPIEINKNSKIFIKDQENLMSSRGLQMAKEKVVFKNICNTLLFNCSNMVQLSELFWPNILIDRNERFPFQKQSWLNTKNFKQEFHGQQRVELEYFRDQLRKWP